MAEASTAGVQQSQAHEQTSGTVNGPSTTAVSGESRHENSSDRTSSEAPKPLNESLAALRLELSMVKNQRKCPHSPYDYLRYLSVLRFIEWTTNGEKSEQEAANELAVLLWEHKLGNTHNTLKHKTILIQKWAKEFRETGKLEEHVHGTHKKTESELAREDIALAAQKALAKMPKPGPPALREALLKSIFPKFGIVGSKISENTCRNYMEKWGWKTGAYRQWVPRNKRLLDVPESDSEDVNVASEETSVLESQSPRLSGTKPKTWTTQIPSPTTAILTAGSTQPTILTPTNGLDEFPNNPGNLASPVTTFTDSTMTAITDRNPTLMWPQPQTYATNQAQFYPFAIQTFEFPSQFQTNPPMQYVQQPQRYTPKSLDRLVPDVSEMMGIRPAINGAPIPNFPPPPSVIEPFSHDTTFPSQNVRRHSQPATAFASPSQLGYMPDMGR